MQNSATDCASVVILPAVPIKMSFIGRSLEATWKDCQTAGLPKGCRICKDNLRNAKNKTHSFTVVFALRSWLREIAFLGPHLNFQVLEVRVLWRLTQPMLSIYMSRWSVNKDSGSRRCWCYSYNVAKCKDSIHNNRKQLQHYNTKQLKQLKLRKRSQLRLLAPIHRDQAITGSHTSLQHQPYISIQKNSSR